MSPRRHGRDDTPEPRGARSPAKKAAGYGDLLGSIAGLLDEARRTSARAVNTLMTATYWEIGRRIVEFEQGGKARAEYGESLLKELAADLTRRFGRGFGWRNLFQMRAFYVAYPPEMLQTASAISPGAEPVASAPPPVGESLQTVSAASRLSHVAARFRLPWSAYVRLLSVKSDEGSQLLRGRGPARRLVGSPA